MIIWNVYLIVFIHDYLGYKTERKIAPKSSIYNKAGKFL